MRHFLLALLIALLPLRGWVGDAMAITLVSPAAAQQLVADLPDCMEHSAAVHAALHAPPANPSDTHAHDGATPHHTAGADEPSHAHGSCEVCNGPAMALGWPIGATLPQPPALAIAPSVRFASTVLPQGVKPPIS
ncbi:MAG: hypothetical protein Q8K24_06780 [Hydrogenophaga sp.]|nr:hypothetical protein [Hydrogenophaga sp.]